MEFQPLSQMFELVDSTANVEHILGVIQHRWGSEYTLVTHDGLQLEESPATQGIYVRLLLISTTIEVACLVHNPVQVQGSIAVGVMLCY